MSDVKIIYRCDPNKNKECTKESCRIYCNHTTNPEYSVDGKKYKWNPLTDEDMEI